VGHEAVEFDEGPLVEQEIEALAGSQLALRVLSFFPPPCSEASRIA
jgi:hypothetical protein